MPYSLPETKSFHTILGGIALSDRLTSSLENVARRQALENRDIPYQWRVEKMKLSKDRTQIVVNESLTLGGVPPAAFEYRLGNRSALEWIIDPYTISINKRSALTSDPNRDEANDDIVSLLGKVITVSLKTMRRVRKQ